MIIDGKGGIIIEESAPPHGGNHRGFAVNEQFGSMLQDLFVSAGPGTCDREAFKRIKEKHARHCSSSQEYSYLSQRSNQQQY